MRSHLGRRRPEPALLLAPVVAVLLVLGLVLVAVQGGDDGDDGDAGRGDGQGDGVALSAGQPTSTPVPGIALPSQAVQGGQLAADPQAALPAPPASEDGGPSAATPPAPPAATPPAQGAGAAPSAAGAGDGRPSAPVAPATPGAEAQTSQPAAQASPEVTVGTCFDGTAESVRDVRPVGCGGLHGNEVYVVLAVPGEAGAAYPGEEVLLEQTGQTCRGQAFTDYVGVEWAESRFFTAPLVPTEATWADGDRALACFLYDLNGPRTGSARGSRM